MSGIVWLASYPKSGNTWVRIFLNNYLSESDEPWDINDLQEHTAGGFQRFSYDQILGIETSDLTTEELLRLRPVVNEEFKSDDDRPLFLKTHDAYCDAEGKNPYLQPSEKHRILYIVRNPLDIAGSFANHYDSTIDEAIERMGREGYTLAQGKKQSTVQVPQFVGSWSHHVRSWLEMSPFEPLLVRYEDMLAQPREQFAKVVRFSGLPFEERRLGKAIEFSNFSRTKKAEVSGAGFRERLHKEARFFRSGAAGKWKEELSTQQIKRVLKNHGTEMRRLGYLENS